MRPIDIPRNETGVVRVFAVNRPMSEMTSLLKTQEKVEVAGALLNRDVTERDVELFPVSDLTGVGLPSYLSDGYAIPETQILKDHGRLSALDGYVLLLFSSAFDGEEERLEPSSDLTLIGTYGEAQPDMTAIPLTSDAAAPYTGIPTGAPVVPPEGRGASMTLVTIAIVILIGLALLWAMA